MAASPVVAAPFQGRRSLTETLAESIAGQVLKGDLQRNNRLPTVQELSAQFAVSRTVIREAIALLKADGLIIARHGAGLFVAEDLRRRPLRIDPSRIDGLAGIIEIMQVRLGLEVEAAGLAAGVRSTAGVKRLSTALKAMSAAMRRGELAAEEDRAFHREIAAATGNQYYASFLEFLGRYIIPHQSIKVGHGTDAERDRYLALLEAEHVAIFKAIKDGQPPAARHAMRLHLERGLRRLQRVAASESPSP